MEGLVTAHLWEHAKHIGIALCQAHLAALGHPARVNTSPAGHGAFLLNTEWRKRIVADIRLTVDEGAAAAALAAVKG